MLKKQMANSIEELKSELISCIYSASTYEEFSKLVPRLKLVADPIFIKPLIECYEKNKSRNDGNTQLILQLLSDYESFLITRFVKAEVEGLKTNQSIRVFLPILTRNSVYNGQIEKKIIEELKSFFITQNILLYYPVSRDLCDFLAHNNRLKIAFPILWENLIANSDIADTFVGVILDDLFKSDIKRSTQYIGKTFDNKIKGTTLERVIATRVKSSGDPLKNQIKEIIRKNGSIEAKLIIQEDSSQYFEISSFRPFLQFDLDKVATVYKIIVARSQINDKLTSTYKTGAVFQMNEKVIEQTKKIYESADITDLMIKLRDYITLVSPDIQITLGVQKIKEILLNVADGDFLKPLNKIILYLNQLGLRVDSELFGLKKIYRLTTLLGSHQTSKSELRKILTELDLLEIYEKNHLSKFHLEILKKYSDCLDTIKIHI